MMRPRAAGSPFTCQQAATSAHRGIHAGQVVADGNPAARRRVLRLAGAGGEVAQAAHRLADRAEGRLVAVGPVLAVAADAGDDEARVHRVQRVRAEAVALELAGAEILHQRIGLGDELLELRLPVRAFEVERDRELVAAMHAEPDGVAIDRRAPAAHRVALGRLHLDHLGAEIGQQPGGEGRGDVVAELDDPEAGEGEVGGRAAGCSRAWGFLGHGRKT